MADTAKLTATPRTEFGKGAARRTRRAGLIPAVLYGHGAEPQHLALPSHDTFLAVKNHANALVTLDIEGKEQTALVKDIQRDPVKRHIEHLDLVIVRAGERVTVEVPVHIEGESAPGTIHQIELQTLTVTVPATRIPDVVTISIDGLEDGTIVRVADIPRPADASIEDDAESVVVVISVPRASAEDLEADEAAAEAGATAGAEGGSAPAEESQEG
ncbi:50S ribosomal protein L25/general stress protein Ctc [Georgenia sp. EYE_87]|uniref:50S ribosomal protein L25/general stress protein Ctc n=1 Tax=Georgenia sp. EYE_87 TaxID=2853448 RepID=UPI00200486D3|nr:50S ribosomal protein L25/general stress protein Ctc [Georgenia sp. EYE_87]MCK6211010.1 50S ribosomal protein L25/general stress protein Ctc [Georgenia sp. EYE_87]